MFAASHAALVAHFGRGAKAVLRRASSLFNPNTDESVTALFVKGIDAFPVVLPWPSGSTAIDMDATALEGKLPSGAQFTIDGTTYTSTADLEAVSNVLEAVPITPPLVAQAANNAAVIITQPYGEKTYRAKRAQFSDDEIGGDVGLEDFKLELATADELTKEDTNITFDGSPYKIVSRKPFSPGTEQASVTLHCRA